MTIERFDSGYWYAGEIKSLPKRLALITALNFEGWAGAKPGNDMENKMFHQAMVPGGNLLILLVLDLCKWRKA